jgi:hypothetical protein
MIKEEEISYYGEGEMSRIRKKEFEKQYVVIGLDNNKYRSCLANDLFLFSTTATTCSQNRPL